jgi:two-component system, OmpR family, response regulator
MKLLLVEDEERIASFIVTGLEAHGYEVEHVATGAEALARLRGSEPDLVVLDLALPDIDGLDVLRSLREEKKPVSVIILTARADVDDLVDGLDLGADDYLTKPFAFDELLARVRARLRVRPAEEPTVLRAGKLSLDLKTRQVALEGQAVDLAAREFALLEAFMRHPGQVLSREQLLTQVWGHGDEPAKNVVEVYVGYLRRKLGDDCIETVRGLGYRLPAG